MPPLSHLAKLHYALGQPESTAKIRTHPEDFQVREQLSFCPDGEGQHVYLYLEKRNLNTDDLASRLAEFSEIKPVAIGYAGLKDRHAVTAQWFSVDLAGKPEPDWMQLNSDEVRVLEVTRHGRKLKRGAISHNQFQITLNQFSGDIQDVEKRIQTIKHAGAPNYFGEQRFGRNDANLKQAEKLFLQTNRTDNLKNKKRVKRHLRSLYLSAMRSYLFNLLLSQRVADKIWNHPVPGDVFMLDGSQSIFTVDKIDDQIVNRIDELDIHPTGPMWGGGEPVARSDALMLETTVMQANQSWCKLLVDEGLKQERRALRCRVSNLSWEWHDNDLILWLSLPKGCYATSVLRELIVPCL